jgi:cobalt transporter subunit CbtB
MSSEVRVLDEAAGAALGARLLAAAAAALLGAFLVFGVGFAHPEAIHNAAHDSRHSFAFPCH